MIKHEFSLPTTGTSPQPLSKQITVCPLLKQCHEELAPNTPYSKMAAI